MPLLYYWRGDNHRRDLDYGAGYHLNQTNPLLHDIALGDSLWAFTRRRDGAYVMAAELVVQARTRNPAGFRYGPYRVWGDLRRSRYFRADGQPHFEQVLRALSPRTGAKVLGRSFQGRAAVRRLTAADDHILRVACADLTEESRARLLPEERLEAMVLTGDPQSVARLLQQEDPGLATERRQYLYTTAPTRSRRLVRDLRSLYDGACQVCAWQPSSRYGAELCETHHIQWLSRGGEDTLANVLLLCPNHHRAVHACDAHLDYADLSLDFGPHRERLMLDSHLENLRAVP